MGDVLIQGGYCMAMADQTLEPPFSHNLRLLFQMLRDQGADVEPLLGLSRFTLFAVVWRQGCWHHWPTIFKLIN